MEDNQDRDKVILDFIKKEKIRKIKGLLKSSNIPENYKEFRSLEDYKEDHDTRKKIIKKSVIQSRKEAKVEIKNYLKNLKSKVEKGESLFIVGPKTSGKTVLATTILKQCIVELQEQVYYTRFSSFLNHATSSYLQKEVENLIGTYVDPKVLLIDELDEFYADQKAKSHILNILERRLDERKPTIITSKIGIDEIFSCAGAQISSTIDDYYKEIVICAENQEQKDVKINIDKTSFYNVDTIIHKLEEYKQEKKDWEDGYNDSLCFIKGTKLTDMISSAKSSQKKGGKI